MNDRKAYTGIDYFRFAAALLVVAIHTSPLASYSSAGDFFLTRIAARVAVPFFFMTSGFFLISRYAKDNEKLWAFLRKTAWIYGISIVLYLPLNVYNGYLIGQRTSVSEGHVLRDALGEYFSGRHLLSGILKALLFDGTMYHLWYLPASMLGACLAWAMVRKWGLERSFVPAGALYLLGLFGDSYYGIAAKVPFLEQLYAEIFEITDYTRNGIFFAPVFFILGGIAADQAEKAENQTARKEAETQQLADIQHLAGKQHSAETQQLAEIQDEGNPGQKRLSAKYLAGFGISFLLMSMEGMALHTFKMQRHDSMYVFLPPCAYFLFRWLTFRRGRRKVRLRTSALLIYLIHPMVIVAVRLFGKITGLQEFLIENSLLHFLAVSTVSVFFAVFAVGLWERRKKGKKTLYVPGKDRAWVEIDRDNLRHNAQELKKAMPPGCEMMAVMKAEAYGHGMYDIATCLEQAGVNAFAVATIEEGIRLRRYGILGEILILGYTDPARAAELRRYDLTQTLIDYPYSRCLNRQGCDVKVHIKIDTGMHRLGFGTEDEEKLLHTFKMRRLRVCGIYTHLCAADSRDAEDIRFTKRQIQRFYGLLERLKQRGVKLPKIHLQSSYGLLNYPGLPCDYVRAGIALYGVLSSPCDETRLDLRPVLSLKSRVVLLRTIKKGESVGYGRAFTACRDSRIAVLAAGYADGLPRNLSCGQCSVILNGQLAPVIGRICMDQMIVDVTDVREVSVGDAATLIGQDGEKEISAPETAGRALSITNELLSRMGGRLPRIASS